MIIRVLGSGCKTCKTLHKNVQEVVSGLGLKIDVDYSANLEDLVKTGAMSSPVLVIDDQVMSAGKVPSNKEIEQMILEKCPEDNSKDSGCCCCGGNC